MTILVALAGLLFQGGTEEERSVQVGPLKRVYRLHAPAKVDKFRPMPLVLVFHGGGGGGALPISRVGFSQLADRDGFLVAYPEAHEGNWKDGRDVPAFREKHKQVDDLGFVSAMIDHISAAFPVDPKRIYATGVSNGGIFSHYAGIHLSERFAAIAPVIGGIAEPEADKFKPTAPVSVLMVNGTDDRLVPFDGGPVARNRGRIVSTREAARLWREHNGCAAEPARAELPDKDPNDGCTVAREAWTGGKSGAEVVLLTIRGGGHTWPGRGAGPGVCRDFDAASLIWEFFQAHPKP
jgi:polyhydroxybutyrate depolymerase